MNVEKTQVFPFNPNAYPFNIEIAGITECDEPYTISRENNYCYIIEYIVKGSGTIICDDKTYRVKQGDLFILPKGKGHRYAPDKNWTKMWFNVDGVLVKNLLFTYGVSNIVLFSQFSNYKLIEELYDICCSNKTTEQIMTESAVTFLKLVQQLQKNIKRNAVISNESLIKEKLDMCIYEKKSISDIANELCISQPKLIKDFKICYGVTPYQYILEKKIEIAANFLTDSSESILNIALSLGFADQPSFTNRFKKIVGVSPTDYRKNHIYQNICKSNFNYKHNFDNLDMPFDIVMKKH